MTRPFANLRVLDFATTIAGPYCARLLADGGAEVIKIESAEGELMLNRPPYRNGASTAYGQLNAGKRSLVLDLKNPASVDVVKKLVAKADILVENFRPGVMKRFGLSYDVLAAINPELIYTAISGYGQTGPSAGLAAYAPAVHASAGFDLTHLSFQAGRTRPDNCGIYVADILTGTYAYGATVTALVQRGVTGRGQMVDVSMLESMLALTLGEVQAAQFPVPPPGRPMFGPVATSDGFIMPAIASERSFQNVAAAAGRPDWVADPRFALFADRRDNWGHFVDELEAWSTKLTTAEVEAALNAAGVPCSVYRTVAEALQDPQLVHRGALATVNDAGGSFKVMNPPYRLSDADTSVQGFASALGEHSREVLAEAGFSPAEIDTLISTGAAA
ncbi:MAG: CoA transferase [Acetobacteraceae bacterium]|nr:CoA transferase [Acetobacteraceae bacterium]